MVLSHDDLLGLEMADAEALAEAVGLRVRAVRVNGEDLFVTADFDQMRINVEVRGGEIVAVTGVY